MLASFAERLDIGRNRKLQGAALACCSLLLLDLLFYGAIVRPGAVKHAERESRINELRKRHAVGVLYQQQRKGIGALVTSMPTQKDMPLLVKELEQAARRLGLRVGPVNYDIPRTGAEGIAMLTFSFPVTGRYADLKRFVYEVETSARLVGIDALDIKTDQKGEALTLKLMTYVKTGEGAFQER